MQTHSWERPLLSLAGEAAYPSAVAWGNSEHPAADLAGAYAYAESLTAFHSRSFHLASRLLPDAKRRAVRALYAFCRVSDDIVDNPNANPEGELAEWRQRALAARPPSYDPVALAWADTRQRYRIPPRYVEQLIDGVARDLDQNRYATFDELAAYSYGVASTVGLMSMHIIGFSDSAAVPYAIKLGVALQTTNILRDVGEDWRAGRLYLPLEELAAYGLAEEDLARGRVDDRWRDFMRFQIDRNRQLYREAHPGISMLDPDGRLAIAAASDLYSAILDDIERHDFDVLNRRAHVSTGRKLRMLPRIWLRARG
jgi:phytoene synthase